jgi:hypothetical protein
MLVDAIVKLSNKHLMIQKSIGILLKTNITVQKDGVSQCDSSAANLGLLDIYQSVYGDKLSAVHTDSLYCDGGVPSISSTANNLSGQVAQVLAGIAPKADSCEMIEDRIRKKEGEQISTNYLENSLSCVKKTCLRNSFQFKRSCYVCLGNCKFGKFSYS